MNINRLMDLMGFLVDHGDIEENRLPQSAIAPKMQPASVVLRTGLERAALQFNDRQQALLREIADRETELADVRRAASAATAALMELATDEALEGIE